MQLEKHLAQRRWRRAEIELKQLLKSGTLDIADYDRWVSFRMNSASVINLFSIRSFASTSAVARLETMNSSSVTVPPHSNWDSKN